MQKRNAQNLLLSFSTLLLFASPLAAEEINETSQEHVVIGSRPMSDSEIANMQEKRAAEIEQEIREEAAGEERHSLQAFPMQTSPSILPVNDPNSVLYLPIHLHRIDKIFAFDDSIAIEDDSNWKLDSNYATVLRNWRLGDVIAITPNHYNIFSKYNYYITNKNTNTYIAANLFLGPAPFGQYSHWVISLDNVRGNLYLDNGTAWAVDPRDAYIISKWEINDHIIAGSNDEWFTSYDCILINVNRNNFVRSKQF